MDAFAQQPRLEAEAGRGVVVAARDDDACPGRAQRHESVGQQRVAGCGGRRGVEDVAGDDHDVDLVLAHLSDQRLEHTAQRIERGMAVERPPDVPVRGVQDPHATHGMRDLRHLR